MSVLGRFLLALMLMWGLVVFGGLLGFVGHLMRERSLKRAAGSDSSRSTEVLRRTSTGRADG